MLSTMLSGCKWCFGFDKGVLEEEHVAEIVCDGLTERGEYVANTIVDTGLLALLKDRLEFKVVVIDGEEAEADVTSVTLESALLALLFAKPIHALARWKHVLAGAQRPCDDPRVQVVELAKADVCAQNLAEGTAATMAFVRGAENFANIQKLLTTLADLTKKMADSTWELVTSIGKTCASELVDACAEPIAGCSIKVCEIEKMVDDLDCISEQTIKEAFSKVAYCKQARRLKAAFVKLRAFKKGYQTFLAAIGGTNPPSEETTATIETVLESQGASSASRAIAHLTAISLILKPLKGLEQRWQVAATCPSEALDQLSPKMRIFLTSIAARPT